jgi:hypothetical protein
MAKHQSRLTLLTKHPPSTPLTLGNMREQGLRHLIAYCLKDAGRPTTGKSRYSFVLHQIAVPTAPHVLDMPMPPPAPALDPNQCHEVMAMLAARAGQMVLNSHQSSGCWAQCRVQFPD